MKIALAALLVGAAASLGGSLIALHAALQPYNRSGCYEDEFRFGSLCYAYDNGRTPGTTTGETK